MHFGRLGFRAVEDLDVEFQPLRKSVVLASMLVFEPTIIQGIKDNQMRDLELAWIVEHVAQRLYLRIVDKVLYFRDRLCMLDIEDMGNEHMKETLHEVFHASWQHKNVSELEW